METKVIFLFQANKRLVIREIKVQEIISAIAAVILAVILEEVIRRNHKRRLFEEEQLRHLNSLLDYQKKHIDETAKLDKTLNRMNEDIVLARVDSRTAINALLRASNGTPFERYVKEEQSKLMAVINIPYRD